MKKLNSELCMLSSGFVEWEVEDTFPCCRYDRQFSFDNNPDSWAENETVWILDCHDRDRQRDTSYRISAIIDENRAVIDARTNDKDKKEVFLSHYWVEDLLASEFRVLCRATSSGSAESLSFNRMYEVGGDFKVTDGYYPLYNCPIVGKDDLALGFNNAPLQKLKE